MRWSDRLIGCSRLSGRVGLGGLGRESEGDSLCSVSGWWLSKDVVVGDGKVRVQIGGGVVSKIRLE